ncbi:MAG: sodium:solute symporter [Flavobacteriales bacterium]
MNHLLLALILLLYFGLLLAIAFFTSKNASSHSFFTGDKKSPWYLVAFGMIGTSLSGVTFVSVPGAVSASAWHYYQLVMGFFAGYFVVAYVLLPLYYKHNLSSIYRYLELRLGLKAYIWGAGYFILSRTLGATVRLYLVINVLQLFVFEPLGLEFWQATLLIILMILAYTLKGGVKTIVWTDTLQTFFMLLALVVCIVTLQQQLALSWSELWPALQNAKLTQIGSWNPSSADYFWKHFIGGAFITIAMTGLDQEMMQKNISVKTLKDAQKNMVVFSFTLLVVNALFLLLGSILSYFALQKGLSIAPDDLFPQIIENYLPSGVFIIFIIGLISALFPSVDGAITALTASFCIDILGFERKQLLETERMRIKRMVHIGFAVLFTLLVFFFKAYDDKSIVKLIFLIAGYTYGPLLGLFSFGILTKRNVPAFVIPWIVLAAPLCCYYLSEHADLIWQGYQFGNELLLVNGTLTFVLLFISSFAYKSKPLNETASF